MMEDEAVIARAISGLALCAAYVLLKGVAMTFKPKTTFRSLLEKIYKNPNTEAEVSYMAAKAAKNYGFVDDKNSSSISTASSQAEIVRVAQTAVGPQTDDEEEFESRVNQDKSTWSNIDTNDGAELVPDMVEPEDMGRPPELHETSADAEGCAMVAVGILDLLKCTAECMVGVQELSSPKFNTKLCEYLRHKLRLVVESAIWFLEVSGIEKNGPGLSVDAAMPIATFKLMLVRAKEIEGFIFGCSEDAWIQAAMTMTNVSEYVASIGFNLELCRVVFRKERRGAGCGGLLTSKQVMDINDEEVRIVKQMAMEDGDTLFRKVVRDLTQKVLGTEERELAAHLLKRLTRAGAVSDDLASSGSTWYSGIGDSNINLFQWVSDCSESGEIGRGGSAAVYKAMWLGKPVAKKTFKGEFYQECKKEADILAELSHPNITSMFCFQKDRRTCSIVMELMDKDLDQLMIERCRQCDSPPFTISEAVDIMIEIGEGVNYLHQKGVIHRDLKSKNILVKSVLASQSGVKVLFVRTKVADFGISKTKSACTTISTQTRNTGTSRWMAPEVIVMDPNREVGPSNEPKRKKRPHKIDVYSFGMLCYEILTGDIPFSDIDETSRKTLKQKILDGDRPDLPADCPLMLRTLIEECWDQTPEKRPSFHTICSKLKYVKYLLMADDFQLFTYAGNYLVDRPVAKSSGDPCIRMMDRVRHRLEPFAAATSRTSNVIVNFFDSTDSTNEGIKYDRTLADSPLGILVQLLRSSNVLVQISLFQLLLEERFAIPLVIPYRVHAAHDYRHLIEALNFVGVKLANQEMLMIAENTTLPRVVFVANRGVVSLRETAHMACAVMNCQFPSKYFNRDGGAPCHTILELGVGFLKIPKEQHKPCLVFCVSGDHNTLGMVMEKIADVVIIEIEPNSEPIIPSWIRGQICKLFWSINSSGEGINKPSFHMWGSFNQMTQRITEHLLTIFTLKKFKGSNNGALPLAECLRSLDPLHQKTPISSIEELEAIDFGNARATLLLQKSYNEESELFFESLRKRGQKLQLTQKMNECKEKRARVQAGYIQKLPVLQLFTQLLSEENLVNRSIGVLHMHLAIDRQLQPTLEKAVRKVNAAFEESEMRPNDTKLKDKYHLAMEEHVGQMLGLEHLWRDLSHIFVSDPKLQRGLPKLAAIHLLDGFPLEILDGDASNFHKLWVDTVLIELDSKLHVLLNHKPRVFVLSVVGLQSSGKSTLLNVMFGTKLKASAGMCTRGVFLQLVKSERPEFDYVLILETMGLRAPEFFGRKDAEAQDKRLAAFAVLPADACVVMVANEEDNGLKEVLPMVMLAFQGSALAERNGGRIQSKLFFVYRSVDTNDVKKLGKKQRKLQEDLQEATNAIASSNICGASDEAAKQSWHDVGLLDSFRINTTDEKLSDVKFFGNIKKDTRPPADIPNWEYGSKVEDLREYIHKRVSTAEGWRPLELVEWKQYLGIVWQSIANANFELSFVNHLDHKSYQLMQSALATSRQIALQGMTPNYNV